MGVMFVGQKAERVTCSQPCSATALPLLAHSEHLHPLLCRHKAEMVIFEAARAICNLRDVTTREWPAFAWM